MAKSGTYYVGRVLKLGQLDQEKLLEALKKPAFISHRGNAWTFIDIEEYKQSGEHYVFGRLSKYSPEGEVGVVDEPTRSEIKQSEPNLLVSSSPFVYIPEHSGIVFLKVSGHVDERIFNKRFCEIIKRTHHDFFVDCEIEFVTDLKTFAAKLSSLQEIYKIYAKISPPNPLFSPLWESLKKYLQERNTDRMTILEDAPDSESLNTNLPNLVDAASRQTIDVPFVPEEQIPIGDAAILMAADGYGNGTIRGRKDGEVIIIKTSETRLHFTFDKTPEPHTLYLRALEIFQKIQDQRHMEHGE